MPPQRDGRLTALPLGFVGVNPAVVFGTLELDGGGFIHNEMAAGMQLENGSRAVSGDGSFGHLRDRSRLGGTGREEDALACFHDGAHAHGDDMPGNLAGAAETVRVVGRRLWRAIESIPPRPI